MKQNSIFEIIKISILTAVAPLCISADPIKIMPLGDSITYDNTYADLHNPRPIGLRSGYRNYLWYMLSLGGYQIDFVGTQVAGESIEPYFDPDNEAYPGWTSYDLAHKTAEWLQRDDPDIVLLHAGSNDWDRSSDGIEMILNEIDLYEGSRGTPITVILALIIDRNVHQKWISLFNDNVRKSSKWRQYSSR